MASASTAVPWPDEGAVHLWRVSLLEVVAEVALLSVEERERAGRLRFERDRRAYVASRVAVRTILGCYLDTDPAAIRFEVDANGKPSTVDGGGLSFSLSRSAPLALVAVARGRAVGVDIERIRPLADMDRLASRFLPPAEVAVLRDLPEPDRLAGFFACWTRKEAEVKATGAGLGGHLGHGAAGTGVGDAGWTVRSIGIGPGAAAAVAIEGSMGPVTIRGFRQDRAEAPFT